MRWQRRRHGSGATPTFEGLESSDECLDGEVEPTHDRVVVYVREDDYSGLEGLDLLSACVPCSWRSKLLHSNTRLRWSVPLS